MTTLIAALLALFPILQDNLPHAFPRTGARQIIDNDRVTVWDVTWPKGVKSGMHRHRYDLFGVDLSVAQVKITEADGKTSRVADLKVGQTIYQLKDVTHDEEGVSDVPRHAILIDFKEVQVPPALNHTRFPNAFPRDGARSIVDNNRIAAWDFTWTAGKEVPTHFHDKDAIAIFMESGTLRSTTTDGKTEDIEITPGLTRFNPKGRMHSETLTKGKARAIIVELK